MAAIPLQVLVPGGSASDYDPASVGGDTFPTGPGVWLEVFNGGGSSINATLVTTGTVEGLTIQDRVVPIPAGERVKIPTPSRLYAGADGQGSVTWSSVTSVTVGSFKVD